ncbi:MAG: hypothetical protein NVS4B9_36290 [Ktedonobacteraceae bacterium]
MAFAFCSLFFIKAKFQNERSVARRALWIEIREGLLLVLTFVTGPIYNVVQMSYCMSIIPDELQGRVNSMFRLIAFGGQPLGLALTGLLLQRFGVVITILISTGILLIFALAATLNTYVRNAPSFRASDAK